jgi:isocitrate dehydrogenase
VIKTKGSGIAMGMFNLDASIEGFARACFTYALGRNYPVYLSSKNTILKVYDGTFKNTFERVFNAEVQVAVRGQGPDLRAPPDRRHGGVEPEVERRLPVGLQELRRRRAVDTVAQGYGSLGLMTSVLMSPTASRSRPSGARHRHAALPHASAGQADVDQPIASIYAWTRGLLIAASSMTRRTLVKFAETLEKVCVIVFESGRMTKDLEI